MHITHMFYICTKTIYAFFYQIFYVIIFLASNALDCENNYFTIMAMIKNVYNYLGRIND